MVRNQENWKQEQSRNYIPVHPRDYFLDKDKNIVKEDLFTSCADEIAKSFKFDKPPMKSSQVRKFYDEILRRKMIIELETDEKKKKEAFLKQLPYIRMIISKAVYANNRKQPTVNNNFKKFIENNIGNIKEYKEFEVFCDLFEAVVAYSKKYLGDY